MLTLEHHQQQFSQAIFNAHNANLNFIASNYPSDRLAVYRATILENLRNSLALTFPGIWILLGEECADSVAYAFAQNPKLLPDSGCLDDLGAAFPEFLAQQSALNSLPYLKDYAQYEWLMHRAYGAAHTEAIRPQDLEQFSEDEIEAVRFSFIPSLFIHTSVYPLHRIQDIIEQPDAPALDLQSEMTTALIARPQNRVMTWFVTPATGLFLNELIAGANLSAALATTNEDHDDFDLSAVFQLLLQQGLILAIS